MTAPLTLLLLLAGQTSAPGSNVDPAAARAVADFDAEALTAALRPHPRVLFTDERMAEVRAKIDAAPWAADLAADLRDYADLLCDPKRRERHPADWKVQNGLPKRVTALALAYKLSGERKYLEQAEADMLQLCRQPEFRKQAEERRRQSLPGRRRHHRAGLRVRRPPGRPAGRDPAGDRAGDPHRRVRPDVRTGRHAPRHLPQQLDPRDLGRHGGRGRGAGG